MGLQIGGVVMKDSVTCDCTPESLAMGSFPCLNMQFYAAEKIPCSFLDDAGFSQREKAMNEISMVGFAINDLMLYLGYTHTHTHFHIVAVAMEPNEFAGYPG